MPLLKVGAEPASEATPLEHWARSPLGCVWNMVLYSFYVFLSMGLWPYYRFADSNRHNVVPGGIHRSSSLPIRSNDDIVTPERWGLSRHSQTRCCFYPRLLVCKLRAVSHFGSFQILMGIGIIVWSANY